jgi:hypothetical protein
MTLASQAVVTFAGEPYLRSRLLLHHHRPLSSSDPTSSIRRAWDICDRRWLRRTRRPAPRLGRGYGPHLLVPVEIRGWKIPGGWAQYWLRQRFTNQRSDCRSWVRSRLRNFSGDGLVHKKKQRGCSSTAQARNLILWWTDFSGGLEQGAVAARVRSAIEDETGSWLEVKQTLLRRHATAFPQVHGRQRSSQL